MESERHIRFLECDNYYYIGCFSVTVDEPSANFDKDTLELFTPEMLIGKDWRKYWESSEQYAGKNVLLGSQLNMQDGNAIIFLFPEGVPCAGITVPIEQLNKRNFSQQ